MFISPVFLFHSSHFFRSGNNPFFVRSWQIFSFCQENSFSPSRRTVSPSQDTFFLSRQNIFSSFQGTHSQDTWFRPIKTIFVRSKHIYILSRNISSWSSNLINLIKVHFTLILLYFSSSQDIVLDFICPPSSQDTYLNIPMLFSQDTLWSRLPMLLILSRHTTYSLSYQHSFQVFLRFPIWTKQRPSPSYALLSRHTYFKYFYALHPIRISGLPIPFVLSRQILPRPPSYQDKDTVLATLFYQDTLFFI